MGQNFGFNIRAGLRQASGLNLFKMASYKNMGISLERTQPLTREFCPHGNYSSGFCEGCLEDSKRQQPVWNTIQKLQKESGFKRSNPNFANTTLEIEGKQYQIEVVEDKDSPVLSQVQQLFTDTFGEEEVDPEEILRAAVAGETPFGTEDEIKYKVIVLKEGDKVVSVVAGGHLDLRDKQGNPTKETMLMIGYAVTDKNIRQGGLAREAYISALIDAAVEAQKQGKKFTFAAGECTFTSERFWNRVGWKRVYAQTGSKQEYTELPYIQPALDFDPETGDIATGAGEAPEHLMIDSFDQAPPDKKRIIQTVEAFYRWCNIWPKQAFKNEQAYYKHLQYIQKIAGDFENFVNNSGQLIYLDAPSREKSKQKGLSIHEYAAADHGASGSEDF